MRLARRSLATSPDDSVLKVKTGGQVMNFCTCRIHHTFTQPMTFVQVCQPRTTSKEACTKTVKERSKALISMRDSISKGASSSQLVNEITHLPVKERNAIAASFESSPGHVKVVLPTSTSLALKADLNITWSKLNIIRR